MTRQTLLSSIRDLGAAGAGITGTVLLLAVPGVPNPTIAALALLLIVLGAATLSTRVVAMVSSAAATLSFNYYFLPPYGTFTVADPQHWAALMAFVVVAATASQLSTIARARARDAEALRQRADLAAALLASLSHDLRTPLTAVRTAVGNLQERDLTDAERATQTELAVSGVERLSRLFDDILDMARIDAAAVTADRQWVTPADIVDAALAYAGPAIAQRTVHIAAPPDTEVHVDPRLTSSALAHLIENAAQYSPADQPIEIDGRADADGLQITIGDHGPGLDAADRDHVFERFYRGVSGRRVSGGSGMGLAITRGLLAAEDGRVWSENAPGGGARFTIAVPGATRQTAVEPS